MRADCFLDTNVLVYAAAGRDAEEQKREEALRLIENLDVGLSAQVLQEFFVTVTRKVEIPLTSEKALEWIEQFEAFPCVSLDASPVKTAAFAAERFHVSYWDGAILSAAEALGATTLYSEDFNDGQRYGRVRAENPFRTATE